MKRAVVFAHYDKDSIIDDYVIYYLKELKKISDTIVFVSCCNLADKEIEKLNGIASHVISEEHNEYDFGSYKRGFLYIKDKLNEYDELIFANDSCFGPFYPLAKIFSKMENENSDFWGITKNNYGYKKSAKHIFTKRPHIQSYFIVFKKNIFTNNIFADFMQSIKHEEDKKLIVSSYEIGLSELLINNGYTYGAYINAYSRINNVTILKWRQIIEKYNMPFIKCSLPRLVNKNTTTVEGYQDIIKSVSDYPVELIEKNVDRTRTVNYGKHTSPLWFKHIFYNFLSELPFCLRKLVEILVKRYAPFFRD